jgi:cyclopropane fatty-acyl-phospholipid synthase-like methyltransferase
MIFGLGRSLYRRMIGKSLRKKNRRYWEEQWSREDFDAPWLGRGVSREIISAVSEGWFPAGARALDIGCGQGEVAAWLAERDHPVLGIDIAEAAVQRARAKFGEIPWRLEFQTLDICQEAPAGQPFSILIDRGCFHQIPYHETSKYVTNIARVSTETARLLLFIKSFRGSVAFGDPHEREQAVAKVRDAFSGVFSIDRVAETYLDPFNGERPDCALPGLVFWMSRQRAPV